MKKILIVSLIILSSTVSYGRVVRVSRPVSRPRVSSTRSYSKPKIIRVKPVSRPTTHKASIKPKTTSFSSTSSIKPKSNSSSLISTMPKSTTIKKSLFNDSNDNYNSFSSSGSSYSSSYNNSSGFGLFDFLLLNSIINNSNNHKTVIKEVDNIDENKIIAILEKEIQEEKSKEKPDDKKIKEYQELINKIRKEK